MRHFENKDLDCRCGCGLSGIDPKLGEMLDAIRDYVGSAILVNSGLRCQWNNAKAGGVVAVKHYLPGTKKLDLSKYPKGKSGNPGDSNHTHGTAADIRSTKVSAYLLYQMVKDAYRLGKLPMLAGIGVYDTFVHVDIKPKKAVGLRQWDERTKK